MEMRHAFEAYVKLWEGIAGADAKQCNVETAASRLEAHFSGKKGLDVEDGERIVVVLLDEIDYLVTKKQSVIYNFFDWPLRALSSGSTTRLVVIGVSNTLNLPDRLHPRVQSRIGSKRIVFEAYGVKETVAILEEKTKRASPSYRVFDEDAILFASKKTAQLSGDIRKAFHICRSAAEMLLNGGNDPSQQKPMVRIKDVLKVSRESFNSAQSRSVALCTPFEVLLLVSLASLSKTTGREFGRFDVEEILTKMESMANASGNPMYLPAPTLSETLGILSRLGEAQLISLETPANTSLSYSASLAGSGGAWPLVTMVMDDVAVLVALKDTCHKGLAQKYLSKSF
jgi:origin recognition complex subunit 1